ncbi:hypothetical protein OEZ85_000038 [Tetradesmus obliquus]|uniref:Rhodanese domain-containing protein n=1 Tax=Tetradesmus obliquus TaxID=3088 RepID=A0ABY8UUP3_TETOB|nr:hypothetical protein OEZ85_000038 [Tetradesmus obliquus]
MPTPGARLAAAADPAGYRQAAGLQPGAMSLPASPTMLQYQLQLSSHRSASASHSISPSSGSWPDIDMEQPLAPQLTAASPTAPSGAAALLAAGRQHIKVVCGSLNGWLDLQDGLVLIAAGQGLEDGTKVNPSAFEALAGKGATRKWRQSLSVLPDGPNDVWVPQPMPLGEFMKQHQLEKSSVPLQAQGRSSSVGAAAAEEGPLLSPGAARYQQQRSLVSPEPAA